MENCARRPIVILYAILLVSQYGCRTSKITEVESNKHRVVHELKDSTMTVINSLLEPLSLFNECGYLNLKSKDLCSFNLNNMAYLKCVRSKKENLKLYSDVMSQITKEVDFNDLCYIRYIWQIEDLNDPTSFATAIELLKHDWQPEGELLSVYYAPVYQYANDLLILPHIKYIDGKPWFEYFEKDEMRLLMYHEEINFMNYYYQIKDLWESGRITLTSEE